MGTSRPSSLSFIRPKTSLITNHSGATLIEYSFIAALIAMVATTSVAAAGASANETFCKAVRATSETQVGGISGGELEGGSGGSSALDACGRRKGIFWVPEKKK